MFKGRISRVFDLEAEERGSSANASESSGRFCVPTLDERARLYLRAVHGKRDFTNQEYSDARNLILDAMAADFAAKSEIDLPGELPEASRAPDGIRIPEAAVISIHACIEDLEISERAQVAGPLVLAEPNKRPSVTPARRLAKRSIFIYAGAIAAGVMALVLVGPLLMVWFAPDSKLQTALLESSPNRGSKGDFAVEGLMPRARTVKPVGEPDAGHVEAPAAVASDAVTPVLQRDGGTSAAPPTDQPDLLKRGQKLIAAGEISKAREALKIAAEAGNAAAALELGATYDPVKLREIEEKKNTGLQVVSSTGVGVEPIEADVAMAKAWYEKARDLGSTEATARLDRLTNVPIPRRRPQ